MCKMFNEYLIGKSHIKSGTRCQDISIAMKDGEFKVLCVCDGVGSRAMSDIGAETVLKRVVISYDKIFDLVTKNLESNPQGSKYYILDRFKQDAEVAARRNGVTRKDLSTTCSFLICNNETAVLCAIGDSPIAIEYKDGRVEHMVGNPEDEFANCTYVATSTSALDVMKLKIFKVEELKQVVICSDGAADYLFDVAGNRMSKIFDDIDSREMFESIISTVRDRGHDDTSCAMIRF